MIWKLAEAKNKFSEVFQRALTEGPQEITRHGKERVVVVAAEAYENLQERPSRKPFIDFLLECPVPLHELDLQRDQSLPRDIDL